VADLEVKSEACLITNYGAELVPLSKAKWNAKSRIGLLANNSEDEIVNKSGTELVPDLTGLVTNSETELLYIWGKFSLPCCLVLVLACNDTIYIEAKFRG
jgi:hypothetical protein